MVKLGDKLEAIVPFFMKLHFFLFGIFLACFDTVLRYAMHSCVRHVPGKQKSSIRDSCFHLGICILYHGVTGVRCCTSCLTSRSESCGKTDFDWHCPTAYAHVRTLRGHWGRLVSVTHPNDPSKALRVGI